MKDILEKISSYNLFNYLLPGVLFVVILEKFTTYSFVQENLIVGAFVYYFAGLVISRFGSLIVEPLLRKISFLKFADYEDFVSASKDNAKIEILSETNNMYRTFTTMFLLLALAKVYEFIEYKLPVIKDWNPYILILVLLLMFLYSYRKQTQYITKRIKTNSV
ncbi:MAG: hypothetical protein A3I97_00155 [Candidatus Taylorbacteria bacterium RIFCSPLOWO2_02_FULL_44_35]|nr:MAG: hypothetical protein A3I97_00155 [Candidatus Taylorbacteria bacterium RIFCSPLOWO2_02_FULL_44_35]